MTHQCSVARDYVCAYPDPLCADRGTRLEVRDRDDASPGWIRCTATDDAAGWVPEAWVRRDADGTCTLLRDYTACELTVQSGERVTVSLTESGWAWVINDAGYAGWVPLAHLDVRPDP